MTGNGDHYYPLVNIQKAIEHGHLQWIYPLKMVILIFHSYVSLPEGIPPINMVMTGGWFIVVLPTLHMLTSIML